MSRNIPPTPQTITDINTLSTFLSHNTFPAHSPTKPSSSHLQFEFDCIVICASAILHQAETLFTALSSSNPSLLTPRLVLCGGIGHSTKYIYDAVASHPRFCALTHAQTITDLPEARVLERILDEFFNGAALRARGCQVLVEDESTNCGANAVNTRKVLEWALSSSETTSTSKGTETETEPSSKGSGNHPRRFLLIQDPTMMLRTKASFERAYDDMQPAREIICFPTFVPQVGLSSVSDPMSGAGSGPRVDSPDSGKRETKIVFSNTTPPPEGLWDFERFYDLIMGEIPRVRDDERGYGPKGKGFITHVDVPSDVEEAWERLRAFGVVMWWYNIKLGTCTKRKVRCNKEDPCSNCSKAQIECSYRSPVPSQRHRKRLADDELLSKINEYEGLLRRHSIEFSPLDNSWILSPLEEKLPSRSQSGGIDTNAIHAARETRVENSEASASGDQPRSQQSGGQNAEVPLWLGLSKDLREPPIEQFTQNNNEEKEAPVEFGSSIMALPLAPAYIPAAPGLLEMHPEPKHIFRLWQTFAENVYPLIMIIHAPTVQSRISEVCWNLGAVPKPLQAVMFAVTGTAQALVATHLHTTRDLEVLQALVLFILLDYRSDASVTLTGLAMRIGHKMGLHRTGGDSKMSFFEEEMRVRTWWKIHCLDTRSRRLLGLPPSVAEFGDVRMPLNINDADLHPRMARRPAVEHTGATEMLYCLMKYEVAHWTRTSSTLAEYSVNPLDMIRATSTEGMTTKRKALAEIRQIYETKYIRYCDPSIPFHHLSATVGRLFIYRTSLSCLHPRNQPEGGRLMSLADQDEVFESSVQVLQLGFEVRRTQFSARILELQAAKTQVDALVYMISELRQRVRGHLVRTAWVLVKRMYNDHRELLYDDSKFSTALADLTLEAWESRYWELQAHGEETVPEFIGTLKATRGKTKAYRGNSAQIEGGIPEGDVHIGPFYETLDWACWNDLLDV
ncbi:hypothetical protein NECHADRAFT_86480 [Paecilomyces variotii No. 5]|uniref:Zn(2)-C6 fungal-type domain-containing protein n=1 Tax=Byssochlamys spectabilis (strain No. 5 / NBRC 109023) TaxID=1356009 RepID=V5GCF2_BYSSN|nr:hypothetical protein NECHADRAFT_86480 [Paecilomyces variotii No. 5]